MTIGLVLAEALSYEKSMAQVALLNWIQVWRHAMQMRPHMGAKNPAKHSHKMSILAKISQKTMST